MSLANQDAITRFLAGKGLTAAQIAGVEGNLQIESGGNPAAANAREGAIGVAQWEGGRRTALQSFARSSGGSETDLTTQLGFMWQELQTSEHGALTALLAATTPTAAATAFQSKYERSSTSSLQARIDAANAIAGGGVQGGSGQVTGGGGVAPAGFDWNPLNWPADLATPGLAAVGRLLVDGLMVLFGAVLLIVALVLLAKAGSNGSSTTITLPASGGGGGGKAGGAGKGGGTVAEAEEAAEVAA